MTEPTPEELAEIEEHLTEEEQQACPPFEVECWGDVALWLLEICADLKEMEDQILGNLPIIPASVHFQGMLQGIRQGTENLVNEASNMAGTSILPEDPQSGAADFEWMT